MKKLISIIIPTLNRPELAQASVDSVLQQNTDTSFDLIISNNGGNKITSDIFNDQKYRGKLRYVETSTILPMTKHWEWASQFATGDFVMMLPDRRLLKQGALDAFSRAIMANSDCDAFCCCCDEWLYESGRIVTTQTLEKDLVITPEKILVEFERGVIDRNTLPLGLNSLVSRELICNYRETHGEYYAAISPDFRSAFNFLSFSKKKVYVIAAPLMLTTGFNLSNGGAAFKGDNTYLKSLGDEGVFKYAPRCLEGNVWGSIFEDYLRAKNVNSKNIYFNEIINKPSMNKIMSEEMYKLFAGRLSFRAISRYTMIRKTLSQLGWRASDDFKALISSLRSLRQLTPNWVKKIFRLMYRARHPQKNIMEIAGF